MNTTPFTPPSGGDLWREAGEFANRHPGLFGEALHVRGFGAGARWMHAAMRSTGERLPPFRDERDYVRGGVLKYALCLIGAAAILVLALPAGPAFAILAAAGTFYALEAQAVFLFPEMLRGSRAPRASGRALVVAAGGTVRVMRTVIPIAVRMLSGIFRRRGLSASWAQGCLAIVLWHRRVAAARRLHVDSPGSPPRLELGPVNPLLLRREHVPAGLRRGFRVLWISDLHWRGPADAGCLLAILRIARRERPDLVVLGGDFIERDAALELFARLVRRLSSMAPCVVLPGNHDRSRIAALRAAALRCGGVWLPDEAAWSIENSIGERLRVIGAESAGDRETANPEHRSGEIQIGCVHDPAEWERVGRRSSSRVVAVLAGHLHGGQWVWRQDGGRLLPVAWLYRHAWLRRDHGGRAFIVSRGAGDTFPVRWNCPREVILCELR